MTSADGFSQLLRVTEEDAKRIVTNIDAFLKLDPAEDEEWQEISYRQVAIVVDLLRVMDRAGKDLTEYEPLDAMLSLGDGNPYL